MTPDLNIKFYKARYWRSDAKSTSAGAQSHKFLGRAVCVDVFAYAGGQHGQPFTTFQCYLNGMHYEARLPRRYHNRWLDRLALKFEFECVKRASGIAEIGELISKPYPDRRTDA